MVAVVNRSSCREDEVLILFDRDRVDVRVHGGPREQLAQSLGADQTTTESYDDQSRVERASREEPSAVDL